MGELVALNQDLHRHFGWKPHPSYAFAAGDQAVPVLPRELHVLACHYAIAFVKGDAGFVPMAVLGLYPGQNLCVGVQGQWTKPYIPRHYEFTPFRLARNQDAAMVVCLDSECLVEGGDTSELPLFGADGKASEKVKAISQCLAQQHQETEQARRMAAELAANDLLVPWEQKLVVPGANELMIKGLYKVDEHRISTMEDAIAGKLTRNSALYLAYCQLISMQHLQALANQLTDTTTRRTSAYEGLDQNSTISFDNI